MVRFVKLIFVPGRRVLYRFYTPHSFRVQAIKLHYRTKPAKRRYDYDIHKPTFTRSPDALLMTSGYEPEGREFESLRAHQRLSLVLTGLALRPSVPCSSIWVQLGPKLGNFSCN